MTRLSRAYLLLALAIVVTPATLNAGPGDAAAPQASEQLPDDYLREKDRAERLHAEGSYAHALQVYEALAIGELPAEERRWVEFRIADTAWRNAAATRRFDHRELEESRKALQALINAIERPADRDQVWAEAHESLGDSWWLHEQSRNWHQGWQHYQPALDWWAGHRDLDLARHRYLDVVWRAASPDEQYRHWGYVYVYVPVNVLENARKIAKRPEDRARAHYLLAMALKQQGGTPQQRQRIEMEFEATLELGRRNPWYDDALYHYAQYLASNGRLVLGPNNTWRQEPDFPRALELYRRLVKEFRKGKTRYWDDATNQIKAITEPQLTAAVSNIFLPDSEIAINVSWRNLENVDFALHRVDLTQDVNPTRMRRHSREWIWHIDPSAGRKVRSWSFDTGDDGRHQWGQEPVRLEEPLPTGAYLLTATGGGKSARELVLVTDLAVVLKAWRGQVLAYVCDAVDGSPVPHASVRMWNYKYRDHRWSGSDETLNADGQGLATFTVDPTTVSRESHQGYLVTASIDGRQAFAVGAGFHMPSASSQWKVFAVTDRPAYRPEDTVHWKITARVTDGEGYTTPNGQVIHYEIHGPRGKIDEGSANLNAFGSAWGELSLDESMALGEYQVQYRKGPKREWIGSAQLFRIEEYKLPEFEVAIETATDAEGRPRVFRVGETVEAKIAAGYYFGGPVADANVEVVVYQRPFHRWWTPERDFPWFYDNQNPYQYWWGGQGQVMKRETLKTDGSGHATIAFDTPVGANQDFEYTIEARVTDASRREIVGSQTVRVTRQRYYVYPRAKHHIYSPGDTVEVEFKTIDANNRPVRAEGAVTVTLDRWVEVWTNPAGRDVIGVRHEQAGRGWSLKRRGYDSKTIVTRTIRTDSQGEATMSFAARAQGYYRITWQGDDSGAAPGKPGDPPSAGSVPVTGQTTVWVCDERSTDLGYRSGGVEIIVDKDTFRAGETASIMLSVPVNDRWVLLSVEGDDLHEVRLIHVPNTVKLVQIPIGQRHVPNVWLHAVMVTDGSLHVDREAIGVPPVDNFLDVEVTADEPTYEPRDKGWFTITTRDADGRPVSAELSMCVVDESVFYIQQAYSGDPRKFYYDRKQSGHIVSTTATFNHKAYVKLVENEQEMLQDARTLVHDEKEGNRDGFGDYSEVDNLGGAKGRMAQAKRSASFANEPSADDAMPRREAPGAPMPSAAPMEEQAAGIGGGADRQGGPAVVVRSDFRSTILWQPDITTADNGKAMVPVTYADNLTRWKTTAIAATTGARFGIGSVTTQTRRPLIARLQTPRFFVVGDTVTLSGVLNNNTDIVMLVDPRLEVEGLKITGIVRNGRTARGPIGTVTVPPRGEVRVDWIAAVESPGVATLKLIAASDKHADAMEQTFSVYEHGIEKFVAHSGKVRGKAVTINLDLPKQRKADSTVVAVSVSSSMAVTMLDALPYLVEYPYGCTEQTMSRFMPAVVTARTLQDVGLSADDALGKVFGGIEQQFVEHTHPKGGARRENLRQLDLIVNHGLERLYDFQHGDGGWGWWKKGDSDHYMTAYVLWGLSLAREAGVDVRGHVMDRAARYLELEIVETERQYDLQAWILHALATYHAVTDRPGLSANETEALANAWNHRGRLNAYSRALLALATHHYGDPQKADVLLRNLVNGVIHDETPDTSILLGNGRKSKPAVIGTAHWGADGIYRRWSEGGVESTAFALRALLAIDPDHELIEPVTNWLVKNRRGAQWSNTRDTAITVLALNDYLRTSGELEPELEYELFVNGRSIAVQSITAAEALSVPSRFEIDPADIRDGKNEIRIVRKGEGAIYFSAEATYFSLEDPIPAEGNEMFVRRDYFKLVPRETLLKGYVYERERIHDGDYVTSGERVQVVLTLESKNDLEYLLLEDLKPAGLEAVQLRSGGGLTVRELKSAAVERRFASEAAAEEEAEHTLRQPGRHDAGDHTGRQRWVHQELRDRKVALFIDKLPEGTWEVTYDLRAEVPGRFHALPVLGHAMYVPEIRCNSDEIRLTVNDRAADNIIAVGD